jgi:UDP-GlcNAc:undecaprenyl-phosphate/decaprenyl-phosphate GlcNAc-1-phosphate transferase
MHLYTSLISITIASFVISATFCPLSIQLFKAYVEKASHFTEFRQMHEQPIPRLGGVGIFIGFWISLALLYVLNTGLASEFFFKDQRLVLMLWLAILSFCAFFLGLMDDLTHIRARYKLLIQFLIALITTLTILPLQKVNLPFFNIIELGYFGNAIVVFWIVGIMNAVNLIDGLDSLAGGVIVIALCGLAILSWVHHDLFFLTVTLSLISSVAGFLIFNKHPAKVFMGDSGSLFLGYMIAVLPIIEIKDYFSVCTITPVMLLGLPLIDTTFTMIRRYVQGIPVFSADKNHIHHKLIQNGLSHKQAVRRLHFFSLCFLGIFLATTFHVVDVKLGFVFYFACVWALLFSAGYQEMNRPFEVIRNRKGLKRDRSFLIELSENIGTLYKHASKLEDFFFAFTVWAEQMQAKEIRLYFGDKELHKKFSDETVISNTVKKLTYSEEMIKIVLLFDLDYFDLDSDVKYQTINGVIKTTLSFLIESYPDFIRQTYRVVEKNSK